MQRSDPVPWSEIALVLLAAGRASRFGADKLAAELAGQPLLEHTAAIYAGLPLALRVAVIPAVGACPQGYCGVRVAPGLPQSASLAAGAAGAAALGPAPRGLLVALADMPLIGHAHLERLRQRFDGQQAVCSTDGAFRCPPALFPAAMAASLGADGGDRGARSLLAAAVPVEAAPGELLDIDRPDALIAAERWLALRAQRQDGARAPD